MEDTARALGANGPEGFMIAGVECFPRPLAMKELAEVERVCLHAYRRSFLQTFSENMDLLPAADANSFMQQKMEEAAKLDLSALPSKFAYDPNKIKLTDKLKAWLAENMEGHTVVPKNETPDKEVKRLSLLTAGSLEAGLMQESEYESLTQAKLKKTKVPYVSWWISGTYDGRLAMAWAAFSKCSITKDQLEETVSKNPQMLVRMAQEIQLLSVPAVGNG